MMMPGRKFSAGTGYRYGFNGQEASNEIKGQGNSYTAEFWEYDPRLGRRWNVDPEPVEYESPYATNRNNPIINSDPDGDFPGLGFLIGVVTEFVVQTIEIKLNIRKEYDVKAMVVSGIATQMGLGVTKQINRIKNLNTYVRGALNVAKDVAINSGEQYANKGSVSVTDALINAGVSKVAGDFVEGRVKKSNKYKTMDNSAAKKETRAAKHASHSRVSKANEARNAVEGYVVERATVAAVPGTSAVTRTIDAINNPQNTQNNQNVDVNSKAGATNMSMQPVTSSVPKLKGLDQYVSSLQKAYGNQIQDISYNKIDENSVGISITWKDGKGTTAVGFDSRYSRHTLPVPPTKKS